MLDRMANELGQKVNISVLNGGPSVTVAYLQESGEFLVFLPDNEEPRIRVVHGSPTIVVK